MTLEDELNRMFKIQNQFSNKFDAYTAFQNKSVNKVMEKFYKIIMKLLTGLMLISILKIKVQYLK